MITHKIAKRRRTIYRRAVYKIVIVIHVVVVFNSKSFGQLMLNHTSWSLTRQDHILKFANDTLYISVLSGNRTNTVAFNQKGNLLTVFGMPGKQNCYRDTGFYRIIYQNSGQQLFLRVIKETCDHRRSLFNSKLPFNYIPEKNSAPRDWLQLDPATDSVAGISLYKAYQLLEGRKSKPVIVAVIDNGFDLNHEDLRNVIWINTSEIPGNGIDDDNNGYIDDIHGWNFRSNKKGMLVENERSGATQVYTAFKDKYDHADTSNFTGAEKANYAVYKAAKTEYLDKVKSGTDSTEFKYAYNVNYNSGRLIGDDPMHPQQVYGSPFIKFNSNLSHGTHVAGIIGAERNNQKGIDGIADNVRIMPIVATTGAGDERDKDIANAIKYAVNNGARVINMSFSKRYSTDKKLVDEAIRFAEEKHVLIVHTAGNDGNNDDSLNYYPVARYSDGKKASNFINVGWSRPLFNERLAHPNSGYGKKNVDLFAPGSDIFSTVPGDGYNYKSGSSMSAPCVTGVAALLFSYFPQLSMEQVKDIILSSTYKPAIMVNRPHSKQKVPFSSLSATGGILNAYNAVKMAIDLTDRK